MVVTNVNDLYAALAINDYKSKDQSELIVESHAEASLAFARDLLQAAGLHSSEVPFVLGRCDIRHHLEETVHNNWRKALSLRSVVFRVQPQQITIRNDYVHGRHEEYRSSGMEIHG